MPDSPPPPLPDDPPADIPGYGVRFDPVGRRYLIRNELTGVWLRDGSGELVAFTSFIRADSAWRSHQPRGTAVS
ncbi:hypothetical protein ACWEQL_10730 [Kitasatospora sp. NPDC004240]